MNAHEIHLAARPQGWPAADTFAHVEVTLPALAEGDVLVRNRYLSVDPYMRGRMNDAKSYVAPFALAQAMDGGAVGEVLESRAEAFQPGDIVQSMRGWRDAFVAPGRELRRLDRSVDPLSLHLGALGMPGLTAWVGLRLVEVEAGDRVFISGAAGAVGSLAGQLARQRGAFVVGSAGSDEKVRVLTSELGFDAAINYKTAADGASSLSAGLRQRLTELVPQGIDIYFDNVGGEHLEAALACMNNHGRIAACGSISRYNDESATPGPRNMFLFVTRRLRMHGFIVSDHARDQKAFVAEVLPLIQSGQVRARETVVDGLEQMPRAFLDLLRGGNIGKMIVRV